MNHSSAADVAKRGNHEIRQQQQQPSTSIVDKVIDELSSKLVQLSSGQDLEVEVSILIKFPKKKSNRRGSISKCPTKVATKECSSRQQHQKQQEQQKDDKQQRSTTTPKTMKAASTNIHNPTHKIRDFAFDIESYAKVDPREADKSAHIPREVAEAVAREKIAAVAYRAREKAAEAATAAATAKSSHQMPLANAVQRGPSPDIVTMGSMFDDDSEVQSYDGTTNVTLSESSHYSEYPEPLSSPSTSLPTSQLFPKAHVHYAKKKK